ncbi:hypothetical protein Daci_3221 [Delftia acidovorans SPH-1]|uniref:Phage regulatory protein Rha (Phage_pRha) n=1 Tax=Delftia acidovorans (strain DSM 14801 / SPH-1) TaxID=398578 RepID=A9BW43_DELAS|nr:Rha family transcriptional regulator [Delftia acidovorans]ABX35859.1 hypothetical protein Daci_3221 [Delftia acidovorans SPH-1]QPS74858.1 Rha family transcriptional regulator [Delftia acidovorans]
MNALQNIAPALTMSSREIAELTSKDLGHVNRDIRAMLDSLEDDPELEHVREDKDARGYTLAFHLGRELTYTLLAGYSTQLRRRVIARWQVLEAAHAKTPAELSRMDILRLAMESEQARIQAESERDKAIATKAEIGSRREATAMATASAKSREVARLQHELGRNQQHATVIAVEKATGMAFPKNAYVDLRRVTQKYGLQAVSVVDARYGSVKAWPAVAWRECHGIELSDLFPGQEPA